MQTIHISVVRGRRYRSTDGFQVYTDRGTGAIDWAHPATPRRMLFWEDAAPAAGHQLGGFLAAAHLDGIRPDGHLEGTHLLDERGYPGGTVTYETDPVVFGRFLHAIVTEDAAGNAQTEGIVVHETVANSDPPPASGFRPVDHDPLTGRLTFVFSPSPRLVG
jgi:hypothetical protein